jgi:hypothetical protein
MLRAATTGLTPDESRRRGPTGAWSILEIVNHLADEEVDDFPRRLRLILEDPQQDWPPIDPEGWARERDYQSRDLAQSLERFERQRRESIKWLRSLDSGKASPVAREAAPPVGGPASTRAAASGGDGIDWSQSHTSKFGTMAAGDMLASWLAHDMLHLRQIAKRLHELAEIRAGGYSSAYAGPWGA